MALTRIQVVFVCVILAIVCLIVDTDAKCMCLKGSGNFCGGMQEKGKGYMSDECYSASNRGLMYGCNQDNQQPMFSYTCKTCTPTDTPGVVNCKHI